MLRSKVGGGGKILFPLPVAPFQKLLIEDHGFSPVHQDSALNVATNSSCQHDFLKIPPFPNEILHRIPMSHANHVLFDDRSFVQVLGRVMGGRSNDLHATVVRLSVGIGSDKGRKKGMVDVDDGAAYLGQEISTEDLHIASHDHELDAMLLQQGCNLLFLLWFGFLRDGIDGIGNIEKLSPPSAGVMV